MDKLSYNIIKKLEEHARYSAKELSVMLDATEEEVKKTIDKLEREQIICGYKALIDWDKFSDSHVTALIELQVTPQGSTGFEDVAEYIMQMEEVESVYLMSGGFDLTVIVQGQSFKDVALFVAKRLALIDCVQSTATHFVLRRYKELGIPLIKNNTDDRGLLSL